MSALVDALQPHIARGLLGIQGRADVTINSLLFGKRGGFYPSYDASTIRWTLDFTTSDNVSSFLACECARFGCAAFQTFINIDHDLCDIDRFPWALVRAYYAAFYAGHSLLRAFGSACTRLDSDLAAKMRNVFATYDVSTHFESGLYSMSIANPLGTAMRFENLGGRLGGTHEAFWRVFNEQLKQLEKNVLSGTFPQAEAQSVFVILGQLRSILSLQRTNATWLSLIRNRIQYRHSLGDWYPQHALTSKDRNILGHIARNWNKDPLLTQLTMKTVGELGQFLGACTFLVAACRALLTRIGEKGKRGSAESFAYYGPLRYLKIRKL